MRINIKEIKNKFWVKNKKTLILVLALILTLETLWAISFIKRYPIKSKQNQISSLNQSQGQIASLFLIADKEEAKVGEKITVKINLSTNNREINGTDVVISYDPQLFEAAKKLEKGDLFENLLISDVDNNKGIINITASRLSPREKPVLGEGTLAIVTFTAKKPGEGQIKIVFDKRDTTTSNVVEAKTSQNILTTVTNATIKIKK